jgi:hypothetical protein
MKLFLVILLPAAFLFGQTQIREKDTPQPYNLAEAYQVYSAVLPDDWNASQSTKLLIAQETTNYDKCLRPDEKSEGNEPPSPAVADYLQVNHHSWLLQSNIQIKMPYELVPKAALEKLFQKNDSDGWADFHKIYPQSSGWIELSAVGFDPKRKTAAVYVSHNCGPLCGGGGVELLQKKNDKWQKTGSAGCHWAS